MIWLKEARAVRPAMKTGLSLRALNHIDSPLFILDGMGYRPSGVP